ncbi:MAG TPA: DUF5818 domain-containing protein [Terriglobales bacterium]|nr:DUF5818 domain-containing protein [Terriglobales bacterium]
MTRGSVFLAAVMAVASLGAMAQNNQAQGTQNEGKSNAQGAVTISGCLSSGSGVYTLSDAKGATYTLAGDTNSLQGHVGQEVEVTGQQALESPTSSNTTTQAGTAPATLNVTNTRFVADHCSGAGISQPGPTGGLSAAHDSVEQTATNNTNAQLKGVAQSEAVPAVNNGQLPQTSTILPLLGLIGLGSLVAGFFARR